MSGIRIQGNKIEDKISHIEVILNRLMRQMGTTITGIIPPSIICGQVKNTTGQIFSFAVPKKGKIKSLCVVLNKNSKESVSFNITKSGAFGEMNYTVTTKKAFVTEDINVECDAGDVITITTSADIQEANITLLYSLSYSTGNKIEIPYELLDKSLGDE
jgi:hypothetical protein